MDRPFLNRLSPLALALAVAAPVSGAVFAPATASAAQVATQAKPAKPVGKVLSYGQHPLQQMDFYPADSRFEGPRPLIVFIHGGAWAGGDKADSTGEAKIRHYTAAGYALASINYRLLPEVDIEDQAADVAAAIAMLRDKSRDMALDKRRIVLMGHSAGAHLAALVATDPRWLDERDMRPDDIAGVVLLDGPAYDVPSQIRDAGPLLGFGFQLAFGSRPARQDLLSPITHVDGANARRFLLLHVERPDAQRQALLLRDKLKKSGTDAQVLGFPGKGMEGHNLLNAMLGRRDSPATVPVDEWLAETFARVPSGNA